METPGAVGSGPAIPQARSSPARAPPPTQPEPQQSPQGRYHDVAAEEDELVLKKPSSSPLARFGPHLLAAAGLAVYVALAWSGGFVEVLLRLNRWRGPLDLYGTSGRIYMLAPFQDMFLPPYVEDGPGIPRRSLAVFTAGRSGLENVDALVRQWGPGHFDYLICHFDESMAEWAALDWYKRATAFYAHRQGKMYFLKRALTPWLVDAYEYVHFIDSDAGSPPEQPFDLWAYEGVLRRHGVVLGQPAVTDKVKSSVHQICKQQSDSLLRYTTFVENGPMFSVHVPSGGFTSLWETVDARSVSGYGVDLGWCAYLYEQKGFPQARTCAIVDAHPIDHQDTHSATGQAGYRDGFDYAHWGNVEWARYHDTVGHMVLGWQEQRTLRRIGLEAAGEGA